MKNKVLVIKLPSSWGEVPLATRRLFIKQQVRKTEYEAYLSLLVKLIGKKKYRQLVKHEAVDQIDSMVSDLQQIPWHTPFFDTVKIGFSKHQSPGERLKDCTGIQYALADIAYEKFVKAIEAKNEPKANAALQEIFLCLWRKTTLKNDSQLKKECQKIQVPVKYQLMALQYFSACKKWILEKYMPHLEGKGTAGRKGVDLKFFDTLFTIADSAAFADIYQAYQANIHEIFLYLIKKVQEAKANSPSKTPHQ